MIYCWSISHQNTLLAVREQLSLTRDQQVEWLQTVDGGAAIVLSTCNRLELYVDASRVGQAKTLWHDLLSVRGFDPAAVAPYTARLSGYEAARHLFQVTSGMKSLALGEPQILGQVTRALQMAQANHASGHVLSLLFRTAIHAAKRVHSETTISAGNSSVSSLSIYRAEAIVGDLRDKQVLIIGAGEMGQAVIKGLTQRGVRNVQLVSRTLEAARTVAANWNIAARPITDLKAALIECDVVFTTSSAPFPILSRADIEPIIHDRAGRDLCLLDIAVPRDVDGDVNDLPGVRVSDIDDLNNVIEANRQQREDALPRAQNIVEEELCNFWNAYQERAAVPTIKQLREHAQHIRDLELERIKHRIPEEHHAEIEALFEEFSHRLLNKLLHQPTKNLRVKARNGDGALFATVARDLFGLENEFVETDL